MNLLQKVENAKFKKTAEAAVVTEAGLIGLATLITTATTGVVTVALSPLAIAAIPVAGAAVTVKALSANGKAKESRQLKDEVFAIIYDYLGCDPDTQIENNNESIHHKRDKAVKTEAQICECGYVLEPKMQFCPKCGKKVSTPGEKRCTCGNIISEGVKFCPECGKRTLF